jgi:lipopolysaccharide transport system permease protein
MRSDLSEGTLDSGGRDESIRHDLSSAPVRIYRPRKGWVGFGLSQVLAYRELLYFFTWRNIKIRYKQTLIGAGWAVLQPFFMMIAFSLLFGRVANIPTDGIPRPIFYYAALLPWTYFTSTVSTGSESLTQSQALITKVFFPRVMLPLSFAMSSLMDHAIAFAMLVILMVYFGVTPTITVALLPAFVALAIVSAMGISLWSSALNAIYRDVRYAVPFLLQFGMFVSPVIYPSSRIPDAWQTVYFLNPMAAVIEGFRWALTGVGQAPGVHTIGSVVIALIVLFSGLWFFRRTEGIIADLV